MLKISLFFVVDTVQKPSAKRSYQLQRHTPQVKSTYKAPSIHGVFVSRAPSNCTYIMVPKIHMPTSLMVATRKTNPKTEKTQNNVSCHTHTQIIYQQTK